MCHMQIILTYTFLDPKLAFMSMDLSMGGSNVHEMVETSTCMVNLALTMPSVKEASNCHASLVQKEGQLVSNERLKADLAA